MCRTRTPATEQELLGFALKNGHCYLEAIRNLFLMVTDHASNQLFFEQPTHTLTRTHISCY